MGMGGNGNELMGMGREWELNLRHHGNGIENGNELMEMGREWELNLSRHGNGNELMGMGGNGNAACHSRTSLLYTRQGRNTHTTCLHTNNELGMTSDTGEKNNSSTGDEKLVQLGSQSTKVLTQGQLDPGPAADHQHWCPEV